MREVWAVRSILDGLPARCPNALAWDAKTHTWVEQRSKTDPNLMEKGRAILDKRAPRPEALRE